MLYAQPSNRLCYVFRGRRHIPEVLKTKDVPAHMEPRLPFFANLTSVDPQATLRRSDVSVRVCSVGQFPSA